LRSRLSALPGGRVLPAAGLQEVKNGAFVSVAGLVLVRQRPGSAKGVVFMTIEDETGVANAIVWPKMLERYRRVVMGARLILVHGQVQRQGSIIHVVSRRLEDRSDWLGLLCEGGSSMKIPIANADEVLRPEPGSQRASAADQEAAADRVHPRFARPARPGHPRAARVMPKSRDFH
jgi:error-prone DNA polymerase